MYALYIFKQFSAHERERERITANLVTKKAHHAHSRLEIEYTTQISNEPSEFSYMYVTDQCVNNIRTKNEVGPYRRRKR